MNNDLIDRKQVIEALQRLETVSGSGYILGLCLHAVIHVPPAEINLCGFKPEILLTIATLMQKENISPEQAIAVFMDHTAFAEKLMTETYNYMHGLLFDGYTLEDPPCRE